MTDELKSQITALRTAIMRRIEYEQCIHASSIEDEIGKWVREVMEPKPIVAKATDFGHGELTMVDKFSVANALVRSAENQRRAQALAQQKFNQQTAASGFGLAPLKQEGKPERDPSSRYYLRHEIEASAKAGVLVNPGSDYYGPYWLGSVSGKKFRIEE